MSTITSHVLDTALGRPALGVGVRLERLASDGTTHVLAQCVTDADGRVREFAVGELSADVYRLVFDTEGYFSGSGRTSFYPRVEIVFRIDSSDQHYHVPVLLSPFGYSTYRGS